MYKRLYTFSHRVLKQLRFKISYEFIKIRELTSSSSREVVHSLQYIYIYILKLLEPNNWVDPTYEPRKLLNYFPPFSSTTNTIHAKRLLIPGFRLNRWKNSCTRVHAIHERTIARRWELQLRQSHVKVDVLLMGKQQPRYLSANTRKSSCRTTGQLPIRLI